jgi:hypothetical protein
VGFHATAQQPKPFAFRDLRLGMTLSEFHKMHPSGSDSVSDLSTASLTRHLTQANCGRGTGETKMSGNENVGVIRCGYKVPLEKVVSLLHVSAYNGSSVAELQATQCGPWNSTDSGWGQAISEVLAGSYCGPRDSASSSLTMILYVHRELGSALAEQLAK